ncbi:MAG: VIT1/CCC1 family protein, partial [Syntrophomonadaceae bacterium]|nr:VIT1/CCC1 family protein [Syntrophomonadaceae bacterium]
MERVGLSGETLKALRAMQRNELTESIIYRRIAARVSSPADRQVLERMADEELAHCRRWEEYTGSRPASDRRKVAWYGLLARLLGYTFVLKLMENGERKAQTGYAAIARQLPEAQAVMEDEERHEQHLLQLLDERHLQYVGSVVLGLNDALVELTGTLAGLSFALHDNRLVALAGLVTGIAATLSMASSQF